MASGGDDKKKADGGDDGEASKLRARVNEVAGERDEALGKVESLKNQLDALKRQAEGTNKEYDRLMGEHEKLQKKLEKAGWILHHQARREIIACNAHVIMLQKIEPSSF